MSCATGVMNSRDFNRLRELSYRPTDLGVGMGRSGLYASSGGSLNKDNAYTAPHPDLRDLVYRTIDPEDNDQLRTMEELAAIENSGQGRKKSTRWRPPVSKHTSRISSTKGDALSHEQLCSEREKTQVSKLLLDGSLNERAWLRGLLSEGRQKALLGDVGKADVYSEHRKRHAPIRHSHDLYTYTLKLLRQTSLNKNLFELYCWAARSTRHDNTQTAPTQPRERPQRNSDLSLRVEGVKYEGPETRSAGETRAIDARLVKLSRGRWKTPGELSLLMGRERNRPKPDVPEAPITLNGFAGEMRKVWQGSAHPELPLGPGDSTPRIELPNKHEKIASIPSSKTSKKAAKSDSRPVIRIPHPHHPPKPKRSRKGHRKSHKSHVRQVMAADGTIDVVLPSISVPESRFNSASSSKSDKMPMLIIENTLKHEHEVPKPEPEVSDPEVCGSHPPPCSPITPPPLPYLEAAIDLVSAANAPCPWKAAISVPRPSPSTTRPNTGGSLRLPDIEEHRPQDQLPVVRVTIRTPRLVVEEETLTRWDSLEDFMIMPEMRSTDTPGPRSRPKSNRSNTKWSLHMCFSCSGVVN